MHLVDVAAASTDVGAVSARSAKIGRIAELLRLAAEESDPTLVAVVVAWLSGELPQRQIGVGWAALRSLPAPAAGPSLTVRGVDAAFTEIGAVAGKGSQARRSELINGGVRRRDRSRTDVSASPARRRAAPGRARRGDGRRGREGRRRSRSRGAAGRHVEWGPACGCRGGADRRQAGARPVHPRGRPAGGSDARPDRDGRRRRPREARWDGHLRSQARRCQGSDPPRR